MIRGLLALVVATAGVVVAAHRQDHRRPAVAWAATSGAPLPLLVRASRGEVRTPLPAASTPHTTAKARHHGPAAAGVVPHVLRGWQRLLDVTAYCATGNRTASGAWPQLGMAATLDRSIPFGTTLRIDGYGDVTVTDRIGWGSDVDLYLGAGPACERRASAWGRRRLLVTEVAG